MKTLGALFAILLTAQTAAAAESEEGYGKTHGLIPGVPLVFGPKVSVAIPHPSIGLEVKLANLIGASFDYGFFPDISVDNVTAGFTKGWHLDGRIYPLRGAFFLGAALGQRTFKGSYTTTVPLVGSITPSSTVDVTYLAPEIGWRWVYQSGFFMGVELGWEFVLSFTRTDSPEVVALRTLGQLDPNLDKAINDYGKVGLPHVALFQIGYFF